MATKSNIWTESVSFVMTENLPRPGAVLEVDMDRQELILWRDGHPVWRTPVSTSRFGPGGEPGSRRTPLGWHRVREVIGEHAPPGTEFESRKPTGRILSPDQWMETSGPDCILSRILRLEGLEPSNRHSLDRYIYLHGTNQENRLGAPASQGCVRMGNLAIVELTRRIHDQVTYCLIRAPGSDNLES